MIKNIIDKTGISKENIELNIDKLPRTGKYNHTTKTQLLIVSFTSYFFKKQVHFKRKTIQNNSSNIKIT